jgi:hypothetical protein
MKPPTFDPGIPLAYYLANHPDGVVDLACAYCFYRRHIPFERMVEELKARGIGDEQTGIIAVGGLMKGICPKCEGTRWQSWPKLP